jgi:molecular chaperone DnaK
VFIGIDLGTTNSAIAAFDGERVTLLPNALGENLTPSVVRLDRGGARTVGRKARRGLELDPANTRAEWKRLMGTAERLSFEAAQAALLPEELSAAVLAALLADARDGLGWAPRTAVISTPALFELPQNHATVRAGKLAGLDEVVLIQEPIASAIAAGWHAEQQGTWVVFDLGGGTLDVSLLETRDGRLRVVDHSGDNFLGGKDIDRALCEWTLAQLEQRGLPVDRGADPRLLARLRAACEEAKIELSRAERALIAVPERGAGGADLELPVTRLQLEALAAPVAARALTVVRSLLANNRCRPDEVGKVVLVGGPTAMPGLRAAVGALFGGRVAEGIDPMTVVARGAALYAGTIGLDARPARPAPAARGLAVRIEHPPVTADLEPFVVGRFLPEAGAALPARVRLERADGGFTSAEVGLSAEGSFVLQVKLERHRCNGFRLLALDEAGAPVPLLTDTFAIVHGVSVADPPLSRAVGIACADDTTQIYFARGTPLPARRTFVHHTIRAVSAAGGEDALDIPVVQGESRRAHRNRLIGVLQLRGCKRDLPAGSRIEVTLHLDRSGQLHTRADVPSIGQTFEDLAHVLVPSATLEIAARELEATALRAAELQRRVFQAGQASASEAMAEVSSWLAEAERDLAAARAGDLDAAQKLHRLLLDASAALDEGEAILAWPDLETEAQRWTLYYTPLVARWGTAAEQQLFDQALQAAVVAKHRRDAAELERQLDALRSIGKASYCRDPQSLSNELEWVGAHLTQAMDVPLANQLVERARAAQATGNRTMLVATVAQLWDLFPSSPERQERSFGSGVR